MSDENRLEIIHPHLDHTPRTFGEAFLAGVISVGGEVVTEPGVTGERYPVSTSGSKCIGYIEDLRTQELADLAEGRVGSNRNSADNDFKQI